MLVNEFRYEFYTAFPISNSVRTICSFPPISFQLWQCGGYIIHCVCNHSEELPFDYSVWTS